MENPMESGENNSHLFYLIVLGFIASLAFPIKAQEHKLTDTSRFAGHFVPATGNSASATETETPRTKTPATSSNS